VSDEKGPQRSRALRYWIGRLVLGAGGFRVTGEAPAEMKLVIIGAPHTSGWDLPYTLATTFVLGMDVRWMGKHTLFRGPLGPLLRALGGIPVNRGAAGDVVAQMVEAFEREPRLLLAMAPQGTRFKTEHWKSGFYRIAVAAGVPIGCGFLDYGTRTAGMGAILHPSGDVHADMEAVREFYRGIRGKHPERQTEPRLREER
jgi:1-acyl-sn-glycerol-3-phosphate acyltransferase